MSTKLTATSQETFMINLSAQAEQTSQMEGITATLYNRLSTLQPQRLDSMKSEGILENFLNHHTEIYHQLMEQRMENLSTTQKMVNHGQLQSEVLQEILQAAQIA